MIILNAIFSKRGPFAGTERAFVDYTIAMIRPENKVYTINYDNAVFADELEQKRLEGRFQIKQFGNIYNPILIFKLARIIMKIKPDVVVCHTTKTARIFELVRVFTKHFPIVGVNHTPDPHKYRDTDYLIVPNKTFQAIAKDERPINTAFYVPNMTDMSVADGFVEKHFHDPIILGFMGRFSPLKAPDVPIRALRLLKDQGIRIKLRMAGTGELEDSLRKLVSELDLADDVDFLGWVGNAHKFFEELDIFCFTSTEETFGLVIIEAMKASTPVISSDTWGARDITDNGRTGMIYKNEELAKAPIDLAEKIKQMIKNEGAAREMASGAFENVRKNYSTQTVSNQIMEVLSKIVNGK